MGLLNRKFPAFSLEFIGEEIRSMINPELAQDMDILCDVIVYMEYTLHSMQKIVEINHMEEKLQKCREDIQTTEWWKEKQSIVNNAKTAEEVWPFLKQVTK
jgi:L-rhamnose mutarotase